MEDNSNSTNDNSPAGTGEQTSNLAITIVIVVGIILAAVLLFRAPQEDMASPTPGPGTPAAVQPMATPPTSTATQPPRPTNIPATAVQPTVIVPPVVQPTAVQPTIPPVQPSPIQGINWQWANVTDSATGQTTTVPAPAQYTLVFTPEGYVNGIADCNSFTGTYSLTNGLAIKITSTTRAACPEGSLDQQYLQLLSNVAAGGPDGTGHLALETAGGAQRMLFQNGGPAQ
jgi:heat shock protein HslJ